MIAHETVRHVMSSDPVCVDVNTPPSQLQGLLSGNAFHHLPVLDNEVLVGIVSSFDLARVSLDVWVKDASTAAAWLDAELRVIDLMTWEPEFIRDDDTLQRAAEKLSEGNFHALPVLDASDKLVGMLTSTDLLRRIAAGT